MPAAEDLVAILTRGFGGVTAVRQCEPKTKVDSRPDATEDLNVCQLRLAVQEDRVWVKRYDIPIQCGDRRVDQAFVPDLLRLYNGGA